MAYHARSAIIIGAGPNGIAMARQLKHRLGFDNFTIYERSAYTGGTWEQNTYPGCGCDVDSHLYSYSFALNPEWSQQLCDQAEILDYFNKVIDQNGLRHHIQLQIECLGATWSSETGLWTVRLRDTLSGEEYTRTTNVFVSAVGALSTPNELKIEGWNSFEGTHWHSARWNHNVSLRDKKVCVIGAGCSAVQFIPELLKMGANVVQYARSPQWMHPRPNHKFTPAEKWAFRNIPLYIRWLRLKLYWDTDNQRLTYLGHPAAVRAREKAEAECVQYMKSEAPERYHKEIIPTFPLGCKRRVFDPGYLRCLHNPKMDRRNIGIKRVDATGVLQADGHHEDFDIIIYATGYAIQNFLHGMKIVGEDGLDLHSYWKQTRGAQAYNGTLVSGFPNLAILFGPNTFPPHMSVLFTGEVQVNFAIDSLFKPLLNKNAVAVNVKRVAEQTALSALQNELRGTVWQSGQCTNWYLNEFGRNTASFPGYASDFWKTCFWVKWKDFDIQYKTSKRLDLLLPTTSFALCALVTAAGLTVAIRNRGL